VSGDVRSRGLQARPRGRPHHRRAPQVRDRAAGRAGHRLTAPGGGAAPGVTAVESRIDDRPETSGHRFRTL